jgi:hypothetical protein
MTENIVADSSFFCCCETDIRKREVLLLLMSKYDFFIGNKLQNEIPNSLLIDEVFVHSIYVKEEDFFELIRPFFKRSKKHEDDGEYEAIGIAYHLNEHYNLKFLILDDSVAYKFVKANFKDLSNKLTRTIGFIKNCCYIDKSLSPETTLKLLLEMKKAFETYETIISDRKVRPCSLDRKIYSTILIPLITQLQDDNKNGRI